MKSHQSSDSIADFDVAQMAGLVGSTQDIHCFHQASDFESPPSSPSVASLNSIAHLPYMQSGLITQPGQIPYLVQLAKRVIGKFKGNVNEYTVLREFSRKPYTNYLFNQREMCELECPEPRLQPDQQHSTRS